MPGEVAAAEGGIAFGAGEDDAVQVALTPACGRLEFGPKWRRVGVTTQDPGRVHEGEAGALLPGLAEIPDGPVRMGLAEGNGRITDEEHGVMVGGSGRIREGAEGGAEGAFGEENAEEIDAGEGGRVAEDGLDAVERLPVGEEDTVHFALGGDAGAVEDVVAGMQQRLGHAEQGGVEFAPAQGDGEFGRGGEAEAMFEAADEGCGVEVGDRTGAQRGFLGRAGVGERPGIGRNREDRDGRHDQDPWVHGVRNAESGQSPNPGQGGRTDRGF